MREDVMIAKIARAIESPAVLAATLRDLIRVVDHQRKRIDAAEQHIRRVERRLGIALHETAGYSHSVVARLERIERSTQALALEHEDHREFVLEGFAQIDRRLPASEA
jgi:hypothetical protein